MKRVQGGLRGGMTFLRHRKKGVTDPDLCVGLADHFGQPNAQRRGTKVWSSRNDTPQPSLYPQIILKPLLLFQVFIVWGLGFSFARALYQKCPFPVF